MGHLSAIPPWLQVTWAIISGIVLPVGGISWVIYFVHGYLKPMKKMQQQALDLASSSVGTVDEMRKAIQPLIEKADQILLRITPIVEKADGATDDVTAVAHKVREQLDKLNGSLDVGVIKEELRSASASLKTISGAVGGLGSFAGIFGGGKKDATVRD